MPFPPSDYAAYANAIVGKPLALVNAGWSIELAQPPYWRQYTLPAPPNPKPGDKVDPCRKEAEDNMAKYNFKVKIGDVSRQLYHNILVLSTSANHKVFKS